MSTFTALQGVQLQPCCIKTIEKIRSREGLAKVLRYGAPACIFAQMFVGPQNSEIATLYSVTTTDWGLLAEVVKSIDIITKRAILNDAALERESHQSGQLGNFWASIYKAFGGG